MPVGVILVALALAVGAAVVSIPRRWAIALGIALVLSASIHLGQHYWRRARASFGKENGKGSPPERPLFSHTP
jgi:hypothetical protein